MYKKIILLTALSLTVAACGEKNSTTETQGAKDTQTTATTQATAGATHTQQTAAIDPATVDKAALTEEAKKAAQALGGQLKGELQTAIKAGGPAEAISVCHTKAPELARAISNETHMQVSRVSLKNRNPEMGVPSDWQKVVLENFEQRKAAGESPETLAYSEVVDNEYRFMKAIVTEKGCLACHGTEISPAVMTKLKELYPHDQATGFREGDLRGAIVVVKNLAQ